MIKEFIINNNNNNNREIKKENTRGEGISKFTVNVCTLKVFVKEN